MKTRRVLIALGLIGLGVIILTNLGQLDKLWDALSSVSWTVVPLLIVTQLLSYWANAAFYQAFFRMTNREVSFRKLFEVSLAINFANQAIPAGGAAGVTYLTQALHGEVPAGQATLSQLGRYIFTFLSYFAVMALGFILLFFGGNIRQISVRFTILIMLLLLVGSLFLMIFIADRQRLERLLNPCIRLTNRFGHTILRRPIHQPLLSPSGVNQFLDEFYEAYHELATHRKYRLQLLKWGLAGNIFEVMSVYVVFIAFGHWVNAGVVIAGYTFAIIASVAGFLTNGVGVYEAGMIGAFTALGQPFSLAFAVVIVYRALSMILFLPPGLYYYRQHLEQASSDVATA
jgi:uncharacterized protein (TIRG00374 family)